MHRPGALSSSSSLARPRLPIGHRSTTPGREVTTATATVTQARPRQTSASSLFLSLVIYLAIFTPPPPPLLSHLLPPNGAIPLCYLARCHLVAEQQAIPVLLHTTTAAAACNSRRSQVAGCKTSSSGAHGCPGAGNRRRHGPWRRLVSIASSWAMMPFQRLLHLPREPSPLLQRPDAAPVSPQATSV